VSFVSAKTFPLLTVCNSAAESNKIAFFFLSQRFSTGEASGMAVAKGLAVGNYFAHCEVIWIGSSSALSTSITVRVPQAGLHFQFVWEFTSLVF